MIVKQKSPAMKLLELVWGKRCEAAPHSWERVNHSMHIALSLAIGAGLVFDLDDFAELNKFRPGRWIGDAEWAYQQAVIDGNLSFCKSFEQARKRIPIYGYGVQSSRFYRSGFLHRESIDRERERLAVGFSFDYSGERPVVTSFSDGCVIACTYKESDKNKVERRFKLAKEEIATDHKDRKWREKILKSEYEPCNQEIRKQLQQMLALKERGDLFRIPRADIEAALAKLGITIKEKDGVKA
jgi:hypothetical protein